MSSCSYLNNESRNAKKILKAILINDYIEQFIQQFTMISLYGIVNKIENTNLYIAANCKIRDIIRLSCISSLLFLFYVKVYSNKYNVCVFIHLGMTNFTHTHISLST